MIQRISLAMIVRNEETNLEECLKSALEQVDEIIIVDTGSTDETRTIAKKFTQKIYSYEWQGDFSQARNFASSKCTGQWILSLDADEKLDVTQGNIRELIENNGEVEAFFLPLLTNSATEPERFMVIRLFRNTPDYRFSGKIHEQVIITKKNSVGIGEAPLIWHKGTSRKERNKKRYRNLKLLKEALHSNADNCYLKYYLGVEWLGLGRYETALPYFQAAVDGISLEQLTFRGPAVRYLVDCLKFLGRLEEAFLVCEQECRLNPDYTDVFFDAGVILEEQGQYQKAIAYFQQGIQLGEPPLWFYHSKGTESFLAFYHLGFCYEKIGCQDLAEKQYWQALAMNPNYICPLYGLFLLKITNLPSQAVFEYFREKNSFVFDQWGEKLASLFFEAGLPELATACYEQSVTLGGNQSNNRIKSLLYSGRIQEGLDMINRVDPKEMTVDSKVEEIVAYMLMGDYIAAKKQALALWVDSPLERSKVWAMLALIGRLSSQKGYRKPEKSRERIVVQTQLTLMENCLRFNSKYSDSTYGLEYQKLTLAIIHDLAQLSVESNKELIAFIERQVQSIYSLLIYKYPAMRGYIDESSG